jgi:Zn-dependent M32 family carboxypeptidase
MPSVPATRGAVRDAAVALELRQSEDWDNFGPALESLIATAQNVIEKAGMKGTTLT